MQHTKFDIVTEMPNRKRNTGNRWNQSEYPKRIKRVGGRPSRNRVNQALKKFNEAKHYTDFLYVSS